MHLGVSVNANILSGNAVRVGFINSGISKNANRLAERHETRFGYYWKSYDFLPGAPKGNLIQLPTGPVFDENPFRATAFRHDGGEMIFSLPNGLQGYYLATAEGKRLDFGPPELVSDDARVSGNPLIVNGVSCIACHAQGIYPLPKDDVKGQTQVKGAFLYFVASLHREKDAESLQRSDKSRFQGAMQNVVKPFLNQSERESFSIESFSEPIKLFASNQANANLRLVDVAAELGISEDELGKQIQYNAELAKLGLSSLIQNRSIKRDDWEKTSEGISKFQVVARLLNIGTPLVVVGVQNSSSPKESVGSP